MTPHTAQLLLPADLAGDDGRHGLAQRDRDALRAVAQWLDDFVAAPHRDLGRSGTVCPFVPGSLERRTLWLVAEHLADADTSQVVELMDGYRRHFLEIAPAGTEDAIYKTILVVFPDLPAQRAGALFDEVLGELGDRAYREDGVIFGPFFDGNPGTAIYNTDFRPFQSPVPFIFVRHTVVGDWKFFVEDDELLQRWADRFGASGAVALAEELRRMPWREKHP